MYALFVLCFNVSSFHAYFFFCLIGTTWFVSLGYVYLMFIMLAVCFGDVGDQSWFDCLLGLVS